jgi:hypothetical protein
MGTMAGSPLFFSYCTKDIAVDCRLPQCKTSHSQTAPTASKTLRSDEEPGRRCHYVPVVPAGLPPCLPPYRNGPMHSPGSAGKFEHGLEAHERLVPFRHPRGGRRPGN